MCLRTHFRDFRRHKNGMVLLPSPPLLLLLPPVDVIMRQRIGMDAMKNIAVPRYMGTSYFRQKLIIIIQRAHSAPSSLIPFPNSYPLAHVHMECARNNIPGDILWATPNVRSRVGPVQNRQSRTICLRADRMPSAGVPCTLAAGVYV